jgi:hypothetical protein
MERSSGEARAVQQAKQCLVLMPGAQALAGIVGGFSWARPTRAAHAPPEAVTDTALRRGLCDSGHVKGLRATGTRRRVPGNDAQDALATTDRRPLAYFWRDTPADRASL